MEYLDFLYTPVALYYELKTIQEPEYYTYVHIYVYVYMYRYMYAYVYIYIYVYIYSA